MRELCLKKKSPPYAAGDGAVWLLVGLLAGGALTPNLDILNRLSAAEIALLKRGDPSWQLPRGCFDVRRRMAEADALLGSAVGASPATAARGPIVAPAGATESQPTDKRRESLRARLNRARAARRSGEERSAIDGEERS